MKIKNGKRFAGWVQKKWEGYQLGRKTGYGKAAAKEAYEETVADVKRERAVAKARKQAREKMRPRKPMKFGSPNLSFLGDMGGGFDSSYDPIGSVSDVGDFFGPRRKRKKIKKKR